MRYVIKDFYTDWDSYFRHRKAIQKEEDVKHHDFSSMLMNSGPILDREERMFFQNALKHDDFYSLR